MLFRSSDPPKEAWGEDRERPFIEKVPKEFNEDKWKDKPEEERKRQRTLHEKRYRSSQLAGYIGILEAYAAARRGDYKLADQYASFSDRAIDRWQRIDWLQAAGQHQLAVKQGRDAFNGAQGELLPSIAFATVLHRAIEAASAMHSADPSKSADPTKPKETDIQAWKQDLKNALERCSKLAPYAERDLPELERVQQIAKAVAPEINWEVNPVPPKDLGDRPPLDSLGPVRWSPPMAPTWSLAVPESLSKQTATTDTTVCPSRSTTPRSSAAMASNCSGCTKTWMCQPSSCWGLVHTEQSHY